MKEDQLTVRVPHELAEAVERFAYERSVPKSMVVREALAAYLVNAPGAIATDAWSRVSSMVGSLSLDGAAIERDAIGRRLRAHNWRP